MKYEYDFPSRNNSFSWHCLEFPNDPEHRASLPTSGTTAMYYFFCVCVLFHALRLSFRSVNKTYLDLALYFLQCAWNQSSWQPYVTTGNHPFPNTHTKLSLKRTDYPGLSSRNGKTISLFFITPCTVVLRSLTVANLTLVSALPFITSANCHFHFIILLSG